MSESPTSGTPQELLERAIAALSADHVAERITKDRIEATRKIVQQAEAALAEQRARMEGFQRVIGRSKELFSLIETEHQNLFS